MRPRIEITSHLSLFFGSAFLSLTVAACAVDTTSPDAPAGTEDGNGGIRSGEAIGSTSSAIVPSVGWGKIVAYGGRCLDVRNDDQGNVNRVPIQIYDCNGTEAQTWAVAMNGPITNIKVSKVLDAPYTTDHSTTWIFDNWNGPNQQWTMPSIEIRGKADKCLDVPYTSNGSIVWIFQCWGGSNQKWFYDPASELVHTSDGRCLQYGAAWSGSPVVAGACNPYSNNQRWYTGPNGSLWSQGFCLDITDGNTTDRTPVRLYNCNGTEAQSFYFKGEIENVLAGKCLQLPQTSSDIETWNGIEPELFTCNGGVNQLWEDHWQ
jgi:hypothetical protein